MESKEDLQNEVEPTYIRRVDPQELWRTAKWGAIGFCVVHFFFENLMGNSQFAIAPVIFNYWVTSWYVKRQYERNKVPDNLILNAVAVAGVVFLIRLVLGLVLVAYLTR